MLPIAAMDKTAKNEVERRISFSPWRSEKDREQVY
jgi:hypothetical protein